MHQRTRTSLGLRTSSRIVRVPLVPIAVRAGTRRHNACRDEVPAVWLSGSVLSSHMPHDFADRPSQVLLERAMGPDDRAFGAAPTPAAITQAANMTGRTAVPMSACVPSRCRNSLAARSST